MANKKRLPQREKYSNVVKSIILQTYKEEDLNQLNDRFHT